MDNEKCYKVYVYTNKINNKKYVGQTKHALKIRAGKDGRNYAHCTYFWNAIKKYGWNNFESKIIYNDLTKSEADALEIKLIKELNTTNDKYGYNILQGGNTGENLDLKYPVVQFDLHFNYIKKYDSITDAGYKNNIDKSHISQACKHEQYQSGGFIWLFEKDYLFGNYDKEEILYSLNKEFKHPNARPVVQCDLKMNFIAKFGSICEAARDTGVRRNGINDNCTHRIKTSGGYIWMYEDEYEKYKLGLITVDLSSKRNKNPVIQFDKDMNIIAKFLSILDASKATKIDRKSINYACNGKYKHAGGYIWRYASDCQDLITYEQIA